MKPLIGITTDHLPNRYAWAPTVYGQNHEYSDAIVAAGGVPVLIPFIEDPATLSQLYDKLDGILFTGGGDIEPLRYGEETITELHDLSLDRDMIEFKLMKWALQDDKPLLGICRGYQLLNVALGGTLVQDIPSMVEAAQDHEISTERQNNAFIAHELQLDHTSRLAAIIGSEPISANSRHHQAIKNVGPGLVVTARAEDQTIEGVELPRTRFAIGVQCHPESLVQNVPRWGKLFREFVKASSYDTAYLPSAIERSASRTDAPAAVVDAL